MSDPEAPRPYRPVALWFMGIVVAVVALGILGEQLKRRANAPSPQGRAAQGQPDNPLGAPPAPPAPPVDPAKAMTFVLRGTVRGADGRAAVPDALLEFVPRAGPRERATSDGKGAFAWKTPDPAPAVLVWAFLPKVGFGHVFVQGSPGREMAQDLVLVPLKSRTLELRRGGRRAEPGLVLEFHSFGQDGPELLGDLAREVTDGDGACRTLLPDGIPLRVRARWPDHREALGDVPPGTPGEVTVVVLGEPARPAGR